jgi:hypothetical protein
MFTDNVQIVLFIRYYYLLLGKNAAAPLNSGETKQHFWGTFSAIIFQVKAEKQRSLTDICR